MSEDRWAERLKRDRAQVEIVVTMAAFAFGASRNVVASRLRTTGRTCAARRAAMYLVRTQFDWPLRRVAQAMGRDRSTIGLGCRWIEERRDDPRFDRIIVQLERSMASLEPVPAESVGEAA